eukprot:2368973-Rhodomonas_salina.5
MANDVRRMQVPVLTWRMAYGARTAYAGTGLQGLVPSTRSLLRARAYCRKRSQGRLYQVQRTGTNGRVLTCVL